MNRKPASVTPGLRVTSIQRGAQLQTNTNQSNLSPFFQGDRSEQHVSVGNAFVNGTGWISQIMRLRAPRSS